VKAALFTLLSCTLLSYTLLSCTLLSYTLLSCTLLSYTLLGRMLLSCTLRSLLSFPPCSLSSLHAFPRRILLFLLPLLGSSRFIIQFLLLLALPAEHLNAPDQFGSDIYCHNTPQHKYAEQES
jgi:hypothetical protein